MDDNALAVAPVVHRRAEPPPSRDTPPASAWQDICQLFQPDDFDHVFTVVRDPPYKRIESEYRMRWILGGQESFFGDVPPHFNLWFEQAMEGLARNPPNHMDNHLRPMWEFLGGDRVEVFRFEDGLLNVAQAVSALLGIAPPDSLPHTNGSSAFKGELTWDIPQLEVMKQRYGADFERFGYDIRGG